MKTYDLIVLGGGPGGYVAAIKAAQEGLTVGLIEKDNIGGICLNHGCIPTKALLKSAKTYTLFQNAHNFGISVEKDAFSFDLEKIIKRKDSIVRRLTTGVKGLIKKNNIDLINGYGKVINEHEISVNNEVFKGKNIILATGGSAFVPPIPGAKEGLQNGFVVTSKELLQTTTIPQDLLIIGGGVIGVEFATIFNSFGSKVTIIEMEKSIINQMDSDLVNEYTKTLKKDGINIITGAKVTKVNSNSVTYQKDSASFNVAADLVLLSVGVKPNLEAVSQLNLEMTSYGVKVDKNMQTSLKSVYAVGDITGENMLAHVASFEGLVAINHILGKKLNLNYNHIPKAIYGFPEIASIGLTEEQAIKNNIDYTIAKFPLMANGKALADGENTGFIKLIKGNKLDEILGAHIFAYNAVDLIGELGVAMHLEATNAELEQVVHAHPSLSEIIGEVAMKKPIHL